ncbi:MAG: hypothetical protein V3R32_05040 [Nitrosomonadaceae bacterium]
MEHPGVDLLQIKRDFNLEEIQAKIQGLNTRIAFSYRINNQDLINQLNMVLEVYTRAQQEMLNEMFGNGGKGPDLDDKIDIS